MERMLCAQCAAVTYSAAAWKLVERGERCLRCGGKLTLAPSEPLAVAPAREEQERRTG
jgi:hypothetical protein